MAYTKTIWENSPSENTPISAENLNNIENGISNVDTRLTTAETNQGILANLTTTEKTNLVGAINEVDGHTDTNTTDINNAEAVIGNETDTYSASLTYTLDSLVIYNSLLYKCTTAITVAEAWNPSKWTQIDIVSKLKSNYNLIEDGSLVKAGYQIDGKDVYIKKMQTGIVPNNSTTITSTGLTNIKIQKVDWFIQNSDGTTVVQLPYANPGAPVWSFLTDVKTSCKANVSTNHGNLTGWTSYLSLYFTYN